MMREIRRGLAAAALAGLGSLAFAASAEATIGLFSKSTSTFFLRSSASAGPANAVIGFGPPGANWIPIAGDWNGDGTITIGLYDPSNSVFFLRNTNTPGAADVVVQFGPRNPNALPVVGDWDGNGTDTIGLYHLPTGSFHLRNSNSAGPAQISFAFGPGGGHFPIAGDWDGDGRDGVGVYTASSDTVFLRNSLSRGDANVVQSFSPLLSNEFVIAGDFNGDGLDTVSRYEPGPSRFLIHNDLANGGADFSANFGPANSGWLPFAWQPGASITILDSTDGRGGFLWKPSGDHTSNLVVLLPSSFNNRAVAVEIHRAIPPNQSTFVEGGRYTGIANQNRGHWRFRRHGSAYGTNIFVVVFRNDGQTFAYPIPNGANRVD
jgi:hypothetical protein